MKTRTPKRAAIDRQAAKVREQIVAEVERCEWCGRYFSLACHEIARGSSRQKAMTNRACILVLCNATHGIKPSCHSVVGNWPREKQLALLYIRRGVDYDLAAYHAVIGRKKPDQSEVDGWIQQLLKAGK